MLSIMCSVMLLYVVCNAYISFQRMRKLDAYERYGQYHFILHDIDYDTLNRIKDGLGEKVKLGVEKIQNPEQRELAILFCDANAIEMNNYKLDSGDLPESADEIAVSATAKIDDVYLIQEYKVNDLIELDGIQYRLSGIIKDYDYSTTGTYHVALVGQTKPEINNYNVYIYVNDKMEIEYVEDVICNSLHISKTDFSESEKTEAFLNDERIIRNVRLIDYEFDSAGSINDKNIQMLLIGVGISLILTSHVLVTLVFYSYFKNRKKQVGVLKGLGIPDHSIFLIFVAESFIILISGCILGIIFGNGLTRLVFSLIQHARTNPLENFHVITEWSFSLYIFLLCLGLYGIGVVVALLNMVRVNIIILQKDVKRNGIVRRYTDYGGRKITWRFFHRDKTLPERICMVFSLMLIATVSLMILYTNRYMNEQLEQREEYDVEFDLLSDQNEEIWNLPSVISDDQVSYYDVVFDVTAAFNISHSLYDWENDDYLLDDDGYMYCEIVGASRQHYERKIDAMISYDELVASGGALVVDNIGETDDNVLAMMPDELEYKGRCEENGPAFREGSLRLVGRAKFKNWSDQRGISIVVPDELFKDRFDYTNLLIRINATEGQELQLAEKLNRFAPIYHYSFQDHATQYIKENDNHMTVRMTVMGVAVFIALMNACVMIYMHMLLFTRRSKQLFILKVMGHGDGSLLWYHILTELPGCVVGSVVSLFLTVFYIRKSLPPIMQNILLEDESCMLAISMGVVVLLECITILVVGRKIRTNQEYGKLRYAD